MRDKKAITPDLRRPELQQVLKHRVGKSHGMAVREAVSDRAAGVHEAALVTCRRITPRRSASRWPAAPAGPPGAPS